MIMIHQEIDTSLLHQDVLKRYVKDTEYIEIENNDLNNTCNDISINIYSSHENKFNNALKF